MESPPRWRPKRPLTRADLEIWKRSRVQDALLEINKARPGDALCLARLSLIWSDDFFRECASNFLASRFTDADFILADLDACYTANEENKISEDVMDRYISDYLSPAMAKRPVAYAKSFRKSAPLPNHVKLTHLTLVAHELGPTFPKILLPLVKVFVDTVANAMHFFGQATVLAHWTVPSLLKEVCTDIVDPAIEKSRFDNEMKDGDMVGTGELKLLVKTLNGSKLSTLLKPQFDKSCDKMATFQALNPEDFKSDLGACRFRDLKVKHERLWGWKEE